MIKKILKLCKRIVLAGIILYTYNSISAFSSIFIPINFINLFLITIFGFPALFCLILFSFLL